MAASYGGGIRSSWAQRGIIIAAVGVLLVLAAYIWGNRLSASTESSATLASQYANAARFAAMDAFYGAAANLQRSRDAEAARVSAMGASYEALSAENLQRSQAAFADRYAAMDARYGAPYGINLQRSQAAATDRYAAEDAFYGATSGLNLQSHGRLLCRGAGSEVGGRVRVHDTARAPPAQLKRPATTERATRRAAMGALEWPLLVL
jgi:hypothetical protein